MGFFNNDLVNALLGRGYHCSQCGAKMFFENEDEETLICPKCGHEVSLERYGLEDDEEYDALYPMMDEMCGDEEDYGESYDEVCDELSHDD